MYVFQRNIYPLYYICSFEHIIVFCYRYTAVVYSHSKQYLNYDLTLHYGITLHHMVRVVLPCFCTFIPIVLVTPGTHITKTLPSIHVLFDLDCRSDVNLFNFELSEWLNPI